MVAQKKFVGGLQRVAFYASENILIGAELLFSYGDEYPAMPSLKPAGSPSPHLEPIATGGLS
jgi:hypothetical protein